MQLKTFSAATVAEAMAAVRAAFGEEAIIVSSRRSGASYLVTAAVERPEPAPTPPVPHAPPALVNGSSLGHHDAADHPGGVREAAAAILFHRPTDVFARALTAAGGMRSAGALANALGRVLTFEPFDRPPSRSIMLVGPPGAGKTVTAGKLAAAAELARRPAHLVAADVAKAGGIEQVEAYARALGRTAATAADPDEMAELRRRLGQAAMIVDTTGVNPFDAAELARLGMLVRAAEAEPVLVLPAGGDPDESADLARAFATLGVRRIIATRLDAARRLGGILAACHGAGLSLGAASAGPFLADHLIPLDAVRTAALLLRPSDRPVTSAIFDRTEPCAS